MTKTTSATATTTTAMAMMSSEVDAGTDPVTTGSHSDEFTLQGNQQPLTKGAVAMQLRHTGVYGARRDTHARHPQRHSATAVLAQTESRQHNA